MNGTILNIQRFCTDDGPGIRTTVFLKGCPLKCLWCHNPESQSQRAELMYDPKKCTLCGGCTALCQSGCHSAGNVHSLDREACTGCGACAAVCPTGAIELYGKAMTVDEVFHTVKKDKIFYETSDGGVTVSGGEPLFQPRFTAELLKVCKENGISTAIETSGFASESTLLSVIKYCDLVLFDVKETDEALHKLYTGVSFEPILKNLSIVNSNKIPFIIRAPIIPTLNDRASHFKALRKLQDSMEYCQSIQIMPYHRIGSYKYELLNKEYRCNEISEPTKEMVETWNKLIVSD